MGKLKLVLILIAAALTIYFGTFALMYLTKPPGYLEIQYVILPESNPKLLEFAHYFETGEKDLERHFSRDIPLEDYKRISEALKNGSYVELDGRFYEVRSVALVGILELNESQEKIKATINESELKKYRPLDNSIYEWKLDKEVERTRGYRENKEGVYWSSATLQELEEVEELIKSKGEIFKFNSTYGTTHFKILLKTRVSLDLFLDKAKCNPVGEEVKDYPLLEKGLELAYKVKEGGFQISEAEKDKIKVGASGIKIKMSVGELKELYSKFGTCVRYKGGYYKLIQAYPMG